MPTTSAGLTTSVCLEIALLISFPPGPWSRLPPDLPLDVRGGRICPEPALAAGPNGGERFLGGLAQSALGSTWSHRWRVTNVLQTERKGLTAVHIMLFFRPALTCAYYHLL